ncbi:hypothetical protein HU200_061827 [Digitaria exilis]|uniref:Uncharacterized protein n=1 Tax=Digitaria exilis TaxID=1010633 RepID=A0A835ADL3_9POAL|nr:hypothetical protein HU200_061827 [Digitaria exilis]
MWSLWKARNAKVFSNEVHDAPSIAYRIREHIDLWVCRAPRRLDVELLKLWCQTVVDVA